MSAAGRTRCGYTCRTLFDSKLGLKLTSESLGLRSSLGGLRSLCRRGYSATSTRDTDESPPQKSSLGSEQFCNVQVKSRGVIRVDGPDILKFLQGLVTNDVSRLMNGPREGEKGRYQKPSAMYTAILNPQGRFLYDLFLYGPQHSTKEAGGGLPFLLADVDSSLADEIISHLTRHRLRAKVGLENLSGKLKVWQKFRGITISRAWDIQQDAGALHSESSADGTAQIDHGSWCWYRDPRMAELGLRGVFPSDSIPPSVNPGQVFDEGQYLSWRLDHGVPEGSSEIPRGEAIPLEFNLAGLQAISFDKGCYVGQELVARTHHRGVIRKRIMPVQFFSEDGKESQGEVAVGTDIVHTVSKKKVGKVTTSLGSRGLGLIRLDSAFKSSSQLKLDLSDNNIHLRVSRPKWWPLEWGGEDLQQTVANA